MFKYVISSFLAIVIVVFFGLVVFRPQKVSPVIPPKTLKVTPTISKNILPQNPSTLQINYQSTDANKVKLYSFTSLYNGSGPHLLKVLEPDNPAPGVAHHFLYLLPVVKESTTAPEDPVDILRDLNAQNQYNVTLIMPSFSLDPWYADNPEDQNLDYESFMVKELQPWVKANLSTTGSEQHWLLGLSKSGLGAIDLLLRHPAVFTLAAAWDFPADMPTFDQYNAGLIYGTSENYNTNYQLTPAFLETYKSPFLLQNRMWISGFGAYPSDISDFDKLLTLHGLMHTTGESTQRAHIWGSGWIPEALSALNQLSLSLPK